MVVTVSGLCLGLFLTLATPVPTLANSIAVVTGKYLNLRSGPSTNTAKIGEVERGTRLSVIKSQGDWYQVKLSNGKTAWAAGWLLQVSENGSNAQAVRVAGSYANIRTGPGTSYSLLGKATAGQTMAVTGQSGEWYQIDFNGRQGWVANWVVTPVSSSMTGDDRDNPTETPAQTGRQLTAVITGKYANIRSGPSTRTSILATFKRGTRLSVLKKSGDWYQVTFSNHRLGWIAGWLVDIQGTEQPSRSGSNEPPAPPAPQPLPPVQLKAIKTQLADPERFQINITSTGMLDFDVLKSNNRLVLTFKNIDPQSDPIKAVPTVQVDRNNLVEQVQLNCRGNETGLAQLVIDLKRPVNLRTIVNNAGQSLQLDLSTPSLKSKTIVIDPGHGGEDPGATGSTGLKEKDFNLDTAQRLAELLNSLGAKAVLTRTTDTLIPLEQRPAVANELKADLFLSIHANSTDGDRSINGITTYYFVTTGAANRSTQDERSLQLAADVQKALVQELRLTDHGTKQSPGRGYVVLRESKVPAILVETAFISNPSDEALLRSDSFRQRTAEAITVGLVNYFARPISKNSELDLENNL